MQDPWGLELAVGDKPGFFQSLPPSLERKREAMTISIYLFFYRHLAGPVFLRIAIFLLAPSLSLQGIYSSDGYFVLLPRARPGFLTRNTASH